MKTIDQIYINGKFTKPHGTEILELINPATRKAIGQVTLADEKDAQDAIAAAKAAYKSFSQTTKEERMEYLQRLHDAVAARSGELIDTMIQEYGGTRRASEGTTKRAANGFLLTKELLGKFDFVKYVGKTKVVLEPLGVVGLITP